MNLALAQFGWYSLFMMIILFVMNEHVLGIDVSA